MFAWRKKPDGFEWHEYIRTAVKQRREARRERVHAARRAAGQNMNAAGVALAAGSRAAGSAARDGAVAGAGALGLGLLNLWSLLVHGLRVATRPILNAVARPNIGGPVVLAGAIALGAGLGRSRGVGLDREAVMTLAIGIVLMAALVPMLAPLTSWRLPRLSALSGKAAMMAAGLAGSGRRCSLVRERSRPGQSWQRGQSVPHRRRQVGAGPGLRHGCRHAACRRYHDQADGHRCPRKRAALRQGRQGVALRRRGRGGALATGERPQRDVHAERQR